MQEQKFLICKHCGNIVGVIHDSGVPIVCCGEPMQALVANTSDGAIEKHVPVVTIEDNKVNVKVGSVTHPMLEKHYIQWIYVQLEHGGIRHAFQAGETPEWNFCAKNDKVVAVYEYCNLHGLWVTKI